MSLPFDISEKLKSVQVRHYVEWLGRDSHCGYGFAFGYDEKSYSKRSRSKIVHQSTCQHIQNVSVEDMQHAIR